jgi:threonine aldolase
MQDDHENAQILARAIRETDGLWLDPPEVHTNIVWFQIDSEVATAVQLAEHFKRCGILISVGGSHTMRAVVHLGISREMTESTAQVIREAIPKLQKMDGHVPVVASGKS